MKRTILLLCMSFVAGMIFGASMAAVNRMATESSIYRESRIRICNALSRDIDNIQRYQPCASYIEDAMEGRKQ